MKITHNTNYRVEVEVYGPREYPWRKYARAYPDAEAYVDHMKRECEFVASDIVENVRYAKSVRVVCDTAENCSHCGRPWDEVDVSHHTYGPKGMPLCCRAAQNEWESKMKEGGNQTW